MRVCIVPEYPMSLISGGLQVQAIETFQALRNNSENGISVNLLNWSEDLVPADLYHFIGFPPYLERIAELVRQARRPYMITLLMGGIGHPASVWAASLRRVVKSTLLKGGGRSDAIKAASALVTLTGQEADAVKAIYHVPISRIYVVPNGVTTDFFDPSPDAWNERFGKRPFILCVGAIQPRKNQLLLVQAANRLQLPVVLLGPVLPGEQIYAERVGEQMRENKRFGGQWLQTLRNEDPLLPSAYAACRLFVLLSFTETQPLSVMQAMAAGKAAILLKAQYTKDALFNCVQQVNSADLSSVCSTLRLAWNSPQSIKLSPEYSWNAVASRLSTLYASVYHQNPLT